MRDSSPIRTPSAAWLFRNSAARCTSRRRTPRPPAPAAPRSHGRDGWCAIRLSGFHQHLTHWESREIHLVDPRVLRSASCLGPVAPNRSDRPLPVPSLGSNRCSAVIAPFPWRIRSLESWASQTVEIGDDRLSLPFRIDSGGSQGHEGRTRPNGRQRTDTAAQRSCGRSAASARVGLNRGGTLTTERPRRRSPSRTRGPRAHPV
jgi:hypothetical protein